MPNYNATPRISWAFQLQLPIARLLGQHFQMSPGLGSPPAQLLPLRKTLNLPLPAQMTDSNPARDVRPLHRHPGGRGGQGLEGELPALAASPSFGGMAGLFRRLLSQRLHLCSLDLLLLPTALSRGPQGMLLSLD